MVSLGTSVIKREDKPADQVITTLQRRGWEVTGRVGNRVTYLENSGLNITVIDGPMGTVIMPSGPLRGRIFGENVRFISSRSVIGEGKSTDNKMTQPVEATNRQAKKVIN